MGAVLTQLRVSTRFGPWDRDMNSEISHRRSNDPASRVSVWRRAPGAGSWMWRACGRYGEADTREAAEAEADAAARLVGALLVDAMVARADGGGE